MQALVGNDVPVPEPIYCEDDISVLGSPYYLMSYVQGRAFSGCRLPELSPTDRRALNLSVAETLARIHRVRPDEIGLSDYGKPGNYFSRQIHRWAASLSRRKPYLTRCSPPWAHASPKSGPRTTG